MKKGNTASELVGFGYPFYIDYTSSMKKLILEGGYATIDESFLELKFPEEEKRNKGTKTEGFLEYLDSAFPDYKKFLKELDENNLRPAYLRELLCFGSSYRHIQRQFDVIALGSIDKTKEYFFSAPKLSTSIGLMERSLSVFMFRDEEYGFYYPESNLPLKGEARFLVLEKN